MLNQDNKIDCAIKRNSKLHVAGIGTPRRIKVSGREPLGKRSTARSRILLPCILSHRDSNALLLLTTIYSPRAPSNIFIPLSERPLWYLRTFIGIYKRESRNTYTVVRRPPVQRRGRSWLVSDRVVRLVSAAEIVGTYQTKYTGIIFSNYTLTGRYERRFT